MKYLTESQIKKFQDDGFLLLKKFFSEEEMEPIIKSIKKFSELPSNFWEAGKEMAYYETSNENKNERILNRVEKAVDYHPEFQKLANSKKVLSAMEDLMGGPCILFKDKINFKIFLSNTESFIRIYLYYYGKLPWSHRRNGK